MDVRNENSAVKHALKAAIYSHVVQNKELDITPTAGNVNDADLWHERFRMLPTDLILIRTR